MCHDIYPARAQSITTVSLADNTYCVMDGHSSCAPRTVGPRSNLAVHVNRATDDRPAHTAGGHLLSVVQAATNTERLYTQRSQIKEDTVESSVPALEFNLKA